MKFLLILLILIFSSVGIFLVWYNFVRTESNYNNIKEEPSQAELAGISEEQRKRMEYYKMREIQAGAGQGLWYVDPITFLCGRSLTKGVYPTSQECIEASRTLRPVVPINGPCDNFKSICELGSTCYFGKCRKQAKENESCNVYTVCGENLVCGGNGVCVPKNNV